MAPIEFLTSPRGRKIAALVLLAVAVVAAFAFAYARQQANERAFREHFAKATLLERQGKYGQAVDELRRASSFVAPNDGATRARVEKKIAELTKKGAQESRSSSGGSSSQGSGAPGSASGGATTTASTASVTLPEDLSSLLPSKFNGIAGVVAAGKETASVRFDDAPASTSYYAYVYALESAEAAASHAARVVEVGFPANRSTVALGGAFAGGTGHYGENSQGDAMLAFSYGQLAFECLVRSSSLESAEKRAKLADLQKELKKP